MLYNVGPKSRKKTHFGTFLRFFTFFLEGIQTQNPKKTNVYYSIYLAGLRFKNTSANPKKFGMCDLFCSEKQSGTSVWRKTSKEL